MSDPGPMGPLASKLTFSKKISGSLSECDPDQHRGSFSPDLGPNCLQSLTVDNKGRDLLIIKLSCYSLGSDIHVHLLTLYISAQTLNCLDAG